MMMMMIISTANSANIYRKRIKNSSHGIGACISNNVIYN